LDVDGPADRVDVAEVQLGYVLRGGVSLDLLVGGVAQAELDYFA
jgi:hypothetical protein